MRETTSNWVRCPHCGRKIFRIVKGIKDAEHGEFECKCPSCKTLFRIRAEDLT
jgi:uncharacterized Zn-finger protein